MELLTKVGRTVVLDVLGMLVTDRTVGTVLLFDMLDLFLLKVYLLELLILGTVVVVDVLLLVGIEVLGLSAEAVGIDMFVGMKFLA